VALKHFLMIINIISYATLRMVNKDAHITILLIIRFPESVQYYIAFDVFCIIVYFHSFQFVFFI